jgi:hypothetical protein
VGREERLHLGAGKDQAPHRAGGHDVRRRRLAEEDRDLAEEVATAQRGQVAAVDADRGLAVEDHVEVRAGEPLPEDPLALREHLLLERVGHRLELGAAEVGEQGQPGQDVHHVPRHGRNVTRRPAALSMAPREPTEQ